MQTEDAMVDYALSISHAEPSVDNHDLRWVFVIRREETKLVACRGGYYAHQTLKWCLHEMFAFQDFILKRLG